MITEPGIYIGIGMMLSLFLTETLGVTAGGIIVPGYIAMNLESPERLIITFGISIITFLIIKSLSQWKKKAGIGIADWIFTGLPDTIRE